MTTVGVDDVVAFLDGLRESGWEIGIEQYIAAQNVLMVFISRHGEGGADPRTWLAPILCRTPEEQTAFYERCDRWWSQQARTSADTKREQVTTVAASGAAETRRRWLTLAACATAIVLGIVVWLAINRPAGQAIRPAPLDPPPSGPTDPNPPAPPPPRVSVTPAPAGQGPNFAWLMTLAPIVPLALFALWFATARRGPLGLRKWMTTLPVRELAVQVGVDRLFDHAFQQTAQRLRRHRGSPGSDLEPSLTVNATIQNGGWFTPAFGLRQAVPEYLMLVGRTSAHDQQAKLQNEIVDRLRRDGVYVDRYYFEFDQRRCWAEDGRTGPYGLPELAARHPDHSLIIFSDGSEMMSPLTGMSQAWVDSFTVWRERAILTPVSPSQWGYREAALAESGFVICPATTSGIAALVETLQTGRQVVREFPAEPTHYPELLRERPARWLDRLEPPMTVANQLFRDLRSSLGETAYYCLSACAVYPILQWNLTLHLTAKLAAQDKFDDTLLALVRLPWFRRGTMPDWLRLRLVSDMTPTQDEEVRTILRDLLLSALAPPSNRFLLHVASGTGWGARRMIAGLFRRQPVDSPLREHVFVSFMEGRKLRHLSVGVPEALRRLFLRDGHPLLGLRTSTTFVVALTCSLLTWRVTATGAPSVPSFPDLSVWRAWLPVSGAAQFGEGNRLYQQQDYGGAVVAYEEAIRRNPDLGEAYFYLANSYDNLYRPALRGEPDNDGLLSKAVENYRLAAEKVTEPKLNTLALQYLVAAYGADKLNDPAMAEPILRRMIENDPKETANYFALASLYERAGAYGEAELALQQAGTAAPNDAAVYRQLAAFYKGQGDFEKTIGAARAVIERDPQNPEPYYTLATLYWEKAYRDARLPAATKRQYVLDGMQQIDRALELNSEYVEALTYRGLLLRLLATLEPDAAKGREYLVEAERVTARATQLRAQAK